MNEVQGIDVSHYQKAINWKKVADSGRKFAVLKCMYEAQSHRKAELQRMPGERNRSRSIYFYCDIITQGSGRRCKELTETLSRQASRIWHMARLREPGPAAAGKAKNKRPHRHLCQGFQISRLLYRNILQC